METIFHGYDTSDDGSINSREMMNIFEEIEVEITKK